MKRAFDIICTLLLLFALSLPLVIVIILQAILFGRPLFFRQTRAGQGGRPFDILKFRSMREGIGSDAERLTAWGAVSPLDQHRRIARTVECDQG